MYARSRCFWVIVRGCGNSGGLLINNNIDILRWGSVRTLWIRMLITDIQQFIGCMIVFSELSAI